VDTRGRCAELGFVSLCARDRQVIADLGAESLDEPLAGWPGAALSNRFHIQQKHTGTDANLAFAAWERPSSSMRPSAGSVAAAEVSSAPVRTCRIGALQPVLYRLNSLLDFTSANSSVSSHTLLVTALRHRSLERRSLARGARRLRQFCRARLATSCQLAGCRLARVFS